MDSEADRVGHDYERAYSANAEACRYADIVQARLAGAARGVVRAGSVTCIVFGHDFRDRGVAEATIAGVRGCLGVIAAPLAIREMGFGLSLDCRTWAILIAAEDETDCDAALAPLWAAAWGDEPDQRAIAAILAVARLAELGPPDEDEDEGMDEGATQEIAGFPLN